jgi:hypothetical protein
MSTDWREHRDALRRFEAWEAEHASRQTPDFEAAVAWLSDAAELAARWDPGWGSPARAEEHWRELAESQRRLARTRLHVPEAAP